MPKPIAPAAPVTSATWPASARLLRLAELRLLEAPVLHVEEVAVGERRVAPDGVGERLGARACARRCRRRCARRLACARRRRCRRRARGRRAAYGSSLVTVVRARGRVGVEVRVVRARDSRAPRASSRSRSAVVVERQRRARNSAGPLVRMTWSGVSGPRQRQRGRVGAGEQRRAPRRSRGARAPCAATGGRRRRTARASAPRRTGASARDARGDAGAGRSRPGPRRRAASCRAATKRSARSTPAIMRSYAVRASSAKVNSPWFSSTRPSTAGSRSKTSAASLASAKPGMT